MSIRTLTQLSSSIQKDLGWRRKELSQYKSLIDNTAGIQRRTFLRGAIAVLYAHWEGFVKTTGEHYLEFINNQCLSYDELATNITAIAARKKSTRPSNPTK